MSDDLTDDQTNDGGALRKQLEQALKDLKAEKDARAGLEAQVRSTSVKELFAELKADSRGAKFYTGEPTKEALAEWLKSDGDVFATAPEPQAQTPGTQQFQTEVTPQNPQGFQLPPGIDMSQLQGAQAMAANPPAPPQAPASDLETMANKLGTLSFDKPEDVAVLNDMFSGIRSAAAARLAQGGTL